MDEPVFKFADRISPWHTWFAWYPVRTYDGRWRWLKRLRRARMQNHDYLSFVALEQWWAYRLP